MQINLRSDVKVTMTCVKWCQNVRQFLCWFLRIGNHISGRLYEILFIWFLSEIYDLTDLIANHSWKLDHKFDWENKITIDREQNWRVRKIKETIHSISDKNHINSISYSLPEIWLLALKKPHRN